MDWETNLNYWIENAPANVVESINNMNEEEREFAFANDLSFGTAGLRGIIGYGSSLMNEYNIAKYSLAMGKMLLDKYGDQAKEYGVVIAHDNRRNNILFSETAGKVLSALGIRVHFFKGNELQPTPLLSYTIAKGNYIAGINITASHNPPEYSGFKVYNHTGTQMLPDETDLIIKASKEEVNIFDIAQNDENISELSEGIESQFVQTIMNMIPFDSTGEKKDLKVVFTAQHGTAGKLATTLMNKLNVDYTLVKEQMDPDPEFTNTPSPNPQNPDSFIMAREYGDKVGADVLFCTDPDADRFGIEVMHEGKWVHIDGNQLPLIQIYYKLRKLDELDYINGGDFIVKSVVTSKAAEKIAEGYGVKVYDNLTGFKWLISESFKHELQGHECLFAWEESYGSTIRSFTRDKDSFQALVQVIELTDYYKKQDKTLIDVLDDIYKEIGYWYSPQVQLKFGGVNAMNDMSGIVDKARSFESGQKVGEFEITEVIDFLKGYKHFHKDNFVQFVIDGKHRVTVRPSGTEPILRIYFDVVANTMEEAKEIQNKLQIEFERLK